MASEFDFTLILTGLADFTDEQIDALCEAGCDDATAAQRHGRVYLTFSRSAESMSEAILSAINDVQRADIGAGVVRIDAPHLVTQAEIARRTERSRQSVGQYISGQRGPGTFPPPICNITEGQPLWYWLDVAHWLFQNELITAQAYRETLQVAAINNRLELEFLKRLSPEIAAGEQSVTGT